MAGGNLGHRQIAGTEMIADVGPDGIQTRGPGAAKLCLFCDITARAKRKRGQIENVGRDGAGHRVIFEFGGSIDHLEIADQKAQCGTVASN